MTTTDYLISAVLVLLVIPQVRGMRISLRSLLLPLVAVGAAGAYYLKSIPTGGHDVALDVATCAVGVALGLLCGLFTRVFPDGRGGLVSKAGVGAAILWIVGMASRTGFAYEANHGGAHAIYTFSVNNQITGSNAWTAALVLMALVQVLARLVVIRVKAHQAGQSQAPVAVAA
ncbi:MAG TPA: hypothetical protein VGX23_16560 [Actinocrinis sp.]|nr:hypothetical protein [Actinocrinis sp.]